MTPPTAESNTTTEPTTTERELGFWAFDADNHYYEALDAFTRHLDPRLGPRTVQWAEIDGRKYHVVAGRVSHAVKNPTFSPIAKPGALHRVAAVAVDQSLPPDGRDLRAEAVVAGLRPD